MSRTDNGFTLIELLVVILVIGAPAPIAIPKFTRQRDNAYVTAMKASLVIATTRTYAIYLGSGVAPSGGSEGEPVCS